MNEVLWTLAILAAIPVVLFVIAVIRAPLKDKPDPFFESLNRYFRRP